MTRTGSVVGALIVSLALVVTNLLVAFGVPIDVAQLAAINGAAALLGALLTLALFLATLPREKVLEYLVGDNTVVAGQANERVATGEQIRPLDPTPRRAVEQE